MLRCKEIVARSSEYLEGDLSGWQKFNYRLHLLMCIHCRRYMGHFRTAVRVAGRVAKKDLAAPEAERISRRARDDSQAD
jgi:predicted anti-sigma-YlaC factor YlaD